MGKLSYQPVADHLYARTITTRISTVPTIT